MLKTCFVLLSFLRNTFFASSLKKMRSVGVTLLSTKNEVKKKSGKTLTYLSLRSDVDQTIDPHEYF